MWTTGAAISGYAVDINGDLVDGVVVEVLSIIILAVFVLNIFALERESSDHVRSWGQKCWKTVCLYRRTRSGQCLSHEEYVSPLPTIRIWRIASVTLPKKATRVIRVSYVEELTPIPKTQQNRSTNKNKRDVQWKLSFENIGPLNTLAMNAIIAGGGAPRARWDGNTVGSIKPLPDVIGPVAWRFKADKCTIKQYVTLSKCL